MTAVSPCNSATTAATAATSPVDNTANVTTTNDGSDSASASVEVRGASIDIAKVADNPSVSAGDQIGFTITVTNNGTGTARNVAVNDPLPTAPGAKSIDASSEPPADPTSRGRFLVAGPLNDETNPIQPTACR